MLLAEVCLKIYGKVRLTSDMSSDISILQWEPANTAALRGCLAIGSAAQDIDDPDGSRMTERTLSAWLRIGFTGDPAETWFIPETVPGNVVGWYRLELPDLANRDRARLQIVIDPVARRQGFGRDLLRHAAERAAVAGRSALWGEVRDGSAGDAFAAALGAKPGMAAALRRLDLRALPAGKIAGLRAEVADAAKGYTLVRWTGPTPPEYRQSLAGVLNAYADAPHDVGYEAEIWDGDQIGERVDAPLQAMGLRTYTIAAAHDASGALAAMTMLAVAPENPRWGHQGLTAVTRQHRGHRLGLLLKTAMLEWLAEAEPAIEQIETANASVNDHMIAVNEAIGMEVDPPDFHWVQLAVADVLQQG
jgi:GNAT superfamily N-acetyltransferase